MFKKIVVLDENQFAECEIKPSGSYIGNEEDVIKVDVPLFIRLLEYAREEAMDDVILHNIATKLVEIGEESNDPATMEHYKEVIGLTSENSIMTEETMLFRMNSRTLWSRFAWSLLNYSIALNSEIDGKEQAEQRIYSHAKKIGEFATPYYGEEAGVILTNALTTFAKIGVSLMQDLKNGAEINGSQIVWNKSIEDLSTILSDINPEYWPMEAVKSYFDMFVKFWLDSIKARNVRDWEANEIAMDNLDKLVATGTPEMDSLADVFSAGVISQYPEKFKS